MYPSALLVTTNGVEVEILHPGQANHDAGPDFFNAQLRIGNTIWAGNVEIHIKASDWLNHHHNTDPAYNNTILHVVQTADYQAITSDGKSVPTLVMTIPEALKHGYAHLLHTADYPRCHAIINSIPRIKVHAWMSALLAERMESRATQVNSRAELFGGDWERAFFITLARNFGFGKNGEAFEMWARQLPLAAAAHHRDNLLQVEALFLGSAGLLSPDSLPRANQDAGVCDPYFSQLGHEYAYLCRKYGITSHMDGSVWRFLRLRPQMFPHIKLVQLAAIYQQNRATLSRIIDLVAKGSTTEVLKALDTELRIPVSNYWQTHYIFGLTSPQSLKRLSQSSLALIVINTVVPTLCAYAKHTHQPTLTTRAMALLDGLPAERNYIMRQWQNCGLTVTSAADSQSLIHLKRTRCDNYDCLHCRFGYEYLKQINSVNSLHQDL